MSWILLKLNHDGLVGCQLNEHENNGVGKRLYRLPTIGWRTEKRCRFYPTAFACIANLKSGLSITFNAYDVLKDKMNRLTAASEALPLLQI